MNSFSVKIPNSVKGQYPNPMDLVRGAYADYMSANFPRVIGADGKLKDAGLASPTIRPLTAREATLTEIEEGSSGAFLNWRLGGERFHGTARYEQRDDGLHIVGMDGAPIVNPPPFSGSRGMYISDIVREFAQR